MKDIALVISCEHGVDTVPLAYQTLFAPYEGLLQTHRGIDFGALAISTILSEIFACDFIYTQATRLLIDCNRSLTHPHCFSEVTTSLSIEEKKQLIQHYYLPYRESVEKAIKKHINQGHKFCIYQYIALPRYSIIVCVILILAYSTIQKCKGKNAGQGVVPRT